MTTRRDALRFFLPALIAGHGGMSGAFAQGAPGFAPEANPIAGAVVGLYDLPGKADGFIPQGMTIRSGQVYLSGYLWPSPGENSCRVYRLSTVGAVTGQRDIPSACSHGGGMATAGNRLFLSDTRRLLELDPEALFDQARNPVIRSIPLEAPISGSFAAGAADAVWIGLYARNGQGSLWKFPLKTLDGLADGASLDVALATTTMAIPERSQGAAFAPDGSLWLTQSGQKFGSITRIDPESGAILAQHAAPSGIEDIGFDEAGFMWASSETGTKRWTKAPAPFPFVYRIDVKKLR